MKKIAIHLVALASLLVMLTGCTFYVGGKDAGTREAEESAAIFMPHTFLPC